jgi:hypothetical protein
MFRIVKDYIGNLAGSSLGRYRLRRLLFGSSKRNEYQNIPGDKGRPERKADNLVTIYEPTV